MKNTGGPAFPCTSRRAENYMDEGGYARSRTVSMQEGGMSLRDYFAAMAMKESLAWKGEDKIDQVAAMAYQMADAMLKEREKE